VTQRSFVIRDGQNGSAARDGANINALFLQFSFLKPFVTLHSMNISDNVTKNALILKTV
jgi:hypothetical protein